ncbi:hypothetical protein [Aeoliella mucimassa]|uniref:hypothetical protein n=1 Tax=Aeoliella mucimassa TaxID=2527972 RepID=UPI0018D325A1|nr:hypothetical protein [Aeoliella mucimassa]
MSKYRITGDAQAKVCRRGRSLLRVWVMGLRRCRSWTASYGLRVGSAFEVAS